MVMIVGSLLEGLNLIPPQFQLPAGPNTFKCSAPAKFT